MPVFVWTIDHPAGLVLVDTGIIDLRPEIEDMSPTPHLENLPRDVACVINTHLHYDHCGGNRLFPAFRSTSRHASSPTRVRSRTTRSENGSTSTARTMSSTRARWSCYRESACCRRPGIRTGIRWSSSRPTPARTFSEGTWAYGSASSRAARPRDSVASSRWERLRGSPTSRGRESRNFARKATARRRPTPGWR
jgi:hypothetical protein